MLYCKTDQKKGETNMAFDGITIANIVKDLKTSLLDGRISKIAQPEADELLLTIKKPDGQRRLYISASASLPLIYLTDENISQTAGSSPLPSLPWSGSSFLKSSI